MTVKHKPTSRQPGHPTTPPEPIPETIPGTPKQITIEDQIYDFGNIIATLRKNYGIPQDAGVKLVDLTLTYLLTREQIDSQKRAFELQEVQ